MARSAAVALVLAVCLTAGLLAQEPAPPTPAWLLGITRVAYTDLGNASFGGDWPDRVIDDFGACGVQMMFSRVQNGEHWEGLSWKSEFGPLEASLKGEDGTRRIVALCHERGIRYLGYYWAQREPKSLGEAHPDWLARNAQGNPTGYFCANTGYRDLVTNRIVELVRDVGVDGIFFDMFHATANACYCDACKARFREQTGQDPPEKEDFDSLLWQQWVGFKYHSIEDALLHYNRAIKAANPEAALVVNTWNAWAYRSGPSGGNIRNSIREAECVDGLLEETGWYDTVDASFFAFPTRHNFMNWHLAGLCRGKRAFMWGAPSLAGWTTLGATEPTIRVMTMLTNGAVPAHSVPGRDALKSYMAEIAQREAYFRNSQPFPWCGLVMSEKTELWYGRDKPKDRYVKGVYGAFQALTERHLPVSLVTDRDLERGTLEPHRVLFVPNCAALSDAEMETLRTFVRNGGGLVATYETSLYDEHAQRRADLGLADVLKARVTGEFDTQVLRISWASPKQHTAHLYFAPEHPWSTDPTIARTLDVRAVNQPVDTVTRHIPLHCRMLLVEPTEGALSPLRITTAETVEGQAEPQRTNTVAVVESTYGKGKVIYLPFDISWSFFRYGHEYLGRLMELALREVASEPPPVEVAAPSIVQATVHTQPGRLVVNLLNDISSFGRSQNVAAESLYLRREIIPIHDVTVTFRDPALKRFTLIPGGVELPPTQTADGRTVTVPRLDLHCMVVAEEG